jgi:hypothetical protein
MTSTRVLVTLLLALTLGLAATVAAQPVSGPEFISIQPCRLADTRPGFGFGGAYGPPALVGGAVRNFTITGQCAIPGTATAVAFNFTVVPPVADGFLTVWPAGGAFPHTSTVTYLVGEVVANGAIVPLSAAGAISVFAISNTDLVIDVNGYFADVEVLAGSNTALGAGALSSNTTGTNNTATGAMALQNNTTGDDNTALGVGALNANTTGIDNTALGFGALLFNATGFQNTATGGFALFSNTTGAGNTAMGVTALRSNTTGNTNVALGVQALFNNTTGLSNTAIGFNAGVNVTTGNNNIHIGTVGTQTATLIAGIAGVNIGMGATVLVNANGQLGTIMSAAGFKEGIEDLGEDSRRLLGLRPVRFRYKPQHDDPSRPLQYGLVAEEVAAVFPELVYPGPDGAPYSVRYHLLSVLLLNEVQRQERRFEAQQQEIDELRAQVRALVGGKAAVRE